MSKKSPFIGYTVDEIFASEACTYVIQVGASIYAKDGIFVFNKKESTNHYNKILKELVHQFNNGNKKQRKNAQYILTHFKVLPLRIH